MTKNLDLLEENDIWEKITRPFLDYFGPAIFNRKKIAKDIFLRSPADIMLIETDGFSQDVIFAGLVEKQLEYFAKNAPLEYKKELMEIFKDQSMMDGVWEIAKAMDDDEGMGVTQNQERIKRNIQYIRDNQFVFQN